MGGKLEAAMVNAITRVCARGGSIRGRRVAFGFKAEDNYTESERAKVRVLVTTYHDPAIIHDDRIERNTYSTSNGRFDLFRRVAAK